MVTCLYVFVSSLPIHYYNNIEAEDTILWGRVGYKKSPTWFVEHLTAALYVEIYDFSKTV